MKVLSIILGGIIIAWILFIACTRWILVSDATDIQGTWSIAGSEKEVPITDTQITLSDDVTYNYTLDETSKTIEISLGTMSGKSHYVFSLNRQQIVIFDGDYDAFYSTMIDVQDFFTSLFSGNISAQSAGYKTSGSEKTIIRLNRVA